MTGPDTWDGRSVHETVVVTAEMLEAFVRLSGDNHPVHTDEAWARRNGFAGRVVHGMLLGALVSRLLGTRLPGVPGLLQGAKLSFHSPCYVGDRLDITLKVREFVESVQVVFLAVRIEAAGRLIAKGNVQCGVGLHDD